MFILVGLGNPTLRYRHTRHNVGFDALDYIAKANNINIKKKAHFALIGEGKIGGNSVVMAKPQTYMNKSGESIRSLLLNYKAQPENELLILVDDIMLEPGVIRIREKGSSGGHNGLKSVTELSGTADFSRIRIGVGKLPNGADQIKYVTARPSKEDQKLITSTFPDVAKACELIISGNIQKAMNDYNGKSKK